MAELKLIKKLNLATIDLVEKQQEILNKIVEAESPKEMETAAIEIAKIKEAAAEAKAFLKESTANVNAKIKTAESVFKMTEEAIKGRFIETYKVETKIIAKKDENGQTITNENGEVDFKEFKKDNKGSNLFIYKPSKKEIAVDYSKITIEEFPELFKEVKSYELDTEKVAENYDKLPKKEIETKASVGIQWKKVIKNA